MTEDKEKPRITKKRETYNELSQEWGFCVRQEETVVSSANGRKHSPEEVIFLNMGAIFLLIYLHFKFFVCEIIVLICVLYARLMTVVYRGIWYGLEAKMI